jgi:hypothetical protein
LSEKYTEITEGKLYYFLEGHKLDSGEYIEGYVSFTGVSDSKFIFMPLKGELSIRQAHMKKPIRIGNISLGNLKTYDNHNKEKDLQEFLDSSGKLKDEFMDSF